MTTDRLIMAITGTSRGLGRALAEQFAAEGHIVAGCSRGPATFAAEGYRHDEVDLVQRDAARTWLREVWRSAGRLDVVVANAALVPRAALLALTPTSVLEEVIRLNVIATSVVMREAAQLMTLQRHGRLIAISSMAAGLHEPGSGIYAASKAAVVELAKVLAKELAPVGATCNVIAPSVVDTAALEALGAETVDRLLAALPIKRAITPREIAHVISFVASPASSVLTGQVIHLGSVL